MIPPSWPKRIRVGLAPAIVQQIYGPVRELDVIAIEPDLERLLTQALTSAGGPMLDPGVADHLTRQAADASQRQENLGHPLACWCLTPSARWSPACSSAPHPD